MLVFDDNDSLTNRLLAGPAVDQFFPDEDALGEVLWQPGDHQNSVRDLVDTTRSRERAPSTRELEFQ